MGAACPRAGPAGTWRELHLQLLPSFVQPGGWYLEVGSMGSSWHKWASGAAEGPMPPFQGELAQPSPPTCHLVGLQGGTSILQGCLERAGRVLHSSGTQS